MPRAAAIALFAAVSLATPAAGWGAELPNLERGRALYENHCVACHTPKVHRRVPRVPLHTDDLRFIVTVWASQQGVRWSPEDIEDVVHFLDRTYYGFEK